MTHKLAIDFGTTNSVVTHWNKETDSAEIVAIPPLSQPATVNDLSLIPSLVYVQDGHTTVGHAVRENGLDRQKDNRLFRNFKRGIVAYPLPPTRTIDNTSWQDKDAGQVFLRQLVQNLPYPPADIEQLVLTTPVASFENYLTWLNHTLADSVGQRVHIVDESTAAALGYTVTKPNAPVLVFDFGGGTLDLSLVQLPASRAKTGGMLARLLRLGSKAKQHTAKVIAKAGQVIGGSDIDQWLLNDILQRLSLTPQELGQDYTPLLTLCEQAKITLSTSQIIDITFEVAGQTHTLTITRAELEALMEANGFFIALHRIIDKVMHLAFRHRAIFSKDIKHVLLVGGTSLMPSVQRVLSQYFAEAAVQANKPFTAVAEGALQLALGFGLDDYLSHGFGLRYLDPHSGSHQYDEIIPMGTPYPTQQPLEVVLGPAHPQQQAVELIIGQIDTDAISAVEVQYEGDQAVFVAQADQQAGQIMPINPSEAAQFTVPLSPQTQPAPERLKASFSIDARCQLAVTVQELTPKKTLLAKTVIANLRRSQSVDRPYPPTLSGQEPQLASTYTQKRSWRLSIDRLGIMLEMLSPTAISPEAIVAALHHKEFYVRYNAAKMLSRRGDRDARLIAQQMLTESPPATRANVARFLYGFSWYTAQHLFAQALTDEEPRVRESAMAGLSDCRMLDAYQMMAAALTNEVDDVYSSVVWSLKEHRHPAVVPVLVTTLQAADYEIRVHALEILGQNDLPEAIPVVKEAIIIDPDPEVKYAAMLSWLELTGEACLPEMVALIEQESGPTRQAILRGFFHATNYLNIDLTETNTLEMTLHALQTALADQDIEVRKAAVWPLVWLNHPQALALFKQSYYQEPNAEVKAHIRTL